MVRRSWSGFTLVEAVTTTAIAGILLALGVPSFQKFILDARRTTVVNDLLGLVYVARSEAMKRMRYVTICASADGATCSSTALDWERGWIVYVNLDRTFAGAEPDPEEEVVRYIPNDQPGVRVYPGGRLGFTFRPFQINSDNGTLTVCDARGATQPTERRAVIINTVGRPRIATKKADGTELTCG